MSHADPSARQLGFRHGSNLEVGTSPLIAVLPPADEALACQTPSGGRRGDATSRDSVSLPSVNGHDGIGNPGTGGSHSNMAKGGGADEDVLTKEVPHAEHGLETLRALEVEWLMAEALIGYDSARNLRGGGLLYVSDLRDVSKTVLRERFQLKFFEAERLHYLVRTGRTPSASALRSMRLPATPLFAPPATHRAAAGQHEAETLRAEREQLAADVTAARAQEGADEALRAEAEACRGEAEEKLLKRADSIADLAHNLASLRATDFPACRVKDPTSLGGSNGMTPAGVDPNAVSGLREVLTKHPQDHVLPPSYLFLPGRRGS